MNLSDQIRDLVRGIEIQMEELKKALVDECGKTLRLESQLEEAETLITQTSHGAAERIAELEAQIAAASAPADTNKLREAIFMADIPTMAINGMNNFSSWESECWARGALAMRAAALELMNDAALQAPVREVPEGWQLVPIDPTDEMRMACVHNDYYYEIDADWKAMLAAAPLPVAPVQESKP